MSPCNSWVVFLGIEEKLGLPACVELAMETFVCLALEHIFRAFWGFAKKVSVGGI